MAAPEEALIGAAAAFDAGGEGLFRDLQNNITELTEAEAARAFDGMFEEVNDEFNGPTDGILCWTRQSDSGHAEMQAQFTLPEFDAMVFTMRVRFGIGVSYGVGRPGAVLSWFDTVTDCLFGAAASSPPRGAVSPSPSPPPRTPASASAASGPGTHSSLRAGSPE
jgi:hypothetical protein